MLKIGRKWGLRANLSLLRLAISRILTPCRCQDGITPWISLRLLRCISACIRRIFSSATTNSSNLTRIVRYCCWNGRRSPYLSRCCARSTRIIERFKWRSSFNLGYTSSFLSSTQSRRSKNHPVRRTRSSISSGNWICWCAGNSSSQNWCHFSRSATKSSMRRSSTICWSITQEARRELVSKPSAKCGQRIEYTGKTVWTTTKNSVSLPYQCTPTSK